MLRVNLNSVSVLAKEELRVILKEIKFDVEAGQVYTILGKNGSGKTTLIKSLTALLPEEQYVISGNVFFNETNILNTNIETLRRIRRNNIRYVFQDVANSLDPLKKLKYYFILSEAETENIEKQLKYFLLPSYNKLCRLHSYELSGGMAQRLLIVLALLANPNLLILDEPTSGVDYAITNLILLKLKEFVKVNDKSVLIVTQDINFALKASDYISYLSNGSLSKFLTPQNFLKLKVDDDIKNFIQSYEEINNVPS